MQRASKRAPQWLRDLGVFILVMGGAVGICMLLSACYDDNNPFATSVFILAVVLISRFTNGYLPGVLAAAVGVVGVNYLFTYPFHEFNLSIDGYPLTFAVMLVVSVLVSTLTTQIKRQEQLRYEAEKGPHARQPPAQRLARYPHAARGDHGPECNGRGGRNALGRGARHGRGDPPERAVAAAPVGKHPVRHALQRGGRRHREVGRGRRGDRRQRHPALSQKLRHGHPHRGHKAGGDPARADGRHAH